MAKTTFLDKSFMRLIFAEVCKSQTKISAVKNKILTKAKNYLFAKINNTLSNQNKNLESYVSYAQ